MDDTPSRDEALRIMQDEHLQVGSLVARMDDEAFGRPATIGGGDWSAKDLVGHLTTWEEIALRSLDEWRLGDRPWIEEASDGTADDVNAEAQGRKSGLSGADILAAFDGVFERLVGAFRTITESEWRQPASFDAAPGTTLGSFLGDGLVGPAGPFAHASAHLDDLRAYVDGARG